MYFENRLCVFFSLNKNQNYHSWNLKLSKFDNFITPLSTAPIIIIVSLVP